MMDRLELTTSLKHFLTFHNNTEPCWSQMIVQSLVTKVEKIGQLLYEE